MKKTICALLLVTIASLSAMDQDARARFCTPLIAAVKSGSINDVEHALDEIEKRDKGDKTMLGLSDVDGKTALYWAVAGGHTEIVALLIKAGADVHEGVGRYTRLCLAVDKQYPGIADLLIKAGALIKAADDVRGLTNFETPLRFKIVDLFIKANALADILNGSGTPLYVAADCGIIEIVVLLIGAHADVNDGNEYGVSPLYVAARNGHTDIVQHLIDADAIVEEEADAEYLSELPDDCYKTPLYAAVEGGHIGVVKLLLGKIKNVDAPCFGKTPLQLAIEKGHMYIAHLLLERGANVEGYTNLLHWAIANNNMNIVQILFKRGVNVDARDSYHSTSLHCAIFYSGIDVIQFLLDKDATVTVHDGYGATPLHLAVYFKRADVVELLLAYHAEADAIDSRSQTPLQLAELLVGQFPEETTRQAIIELLKSRKK
ncbi:hypothetical protein FACS189449_07690 [Alphaproteobacteria bacterium]|nr:hypothetical protein FACS189449_07690 [Alphaproteobacteria bacterium]